MIYTSINFQDMFRESLAMSFKQLIRFVGVITIWLMCAAAHASSCNINSMTMSPSMPARVVVAGTPTSGKVIFGSNLYIDSTCTFTESAPWSIVTAIPFGTSANPLTNITGVTGQASSAPVATVTGGTCTVNPGDLQGGYAQVSVNFKPGQTCRFIARMQLQFLGTGATPSGTMDPIYPSTANNAGVAGGNFNRWASFASCTSTACTAFAPTGIISTFNSTFVSLPNTCTVNAGSANQTVTLPKLSTFQLANIGSVAGQTPFSVLLDCNNTGGAFSVSTFWTFTESSAQNIILNTGTGTGFGFQINDSSNTPVLNNISRISIPSVVNGTNTLNYWLYYYTMGVVGAGSAAGTATFTLTYN